MAYHVAVSRAFVDHVNDVGVPLFERYLGSMEHVLRQAGVDRETRSQVRQSYIDAWREKADRMHGALLSGREEDLFEADKTKWGAPGGRLDFVKAIGQGSMFAQHGGSMFAQGGASTVLDFAGVTAAHQQLQDALNLDRMIDEIIVPTAQQHGVT